MNKTSKAQVSIEVVIIIIFIIIFLIVFNNLASDTVKTLEKQIVLEQEVEISNALYSFLKSQEPLVAADFNISFENDFYIPKVNLPSKNVQCKVFITSSYITVDTYDYDEIITYNKKVNFDFTKINFSEVIIKSCGDKITCKNNNNMVKCS